MPDPATPTGSDRRRATARRVVEGAQRLTLERGLDGWTMDELAAVLGVSRRTLFNHVAGKVEAVLAVPCRPAEGDPATCAAIDTFRAGGPSGRLLDDVVTLGGALTALPDEIDPELLGTTRAVLAHEPRAAQAEHERFQAVCDELTALILEREGAEFGADRALLVVRLLGAIFDVSIDRFLAPGETRTLPDLFAADLAAAGQLFA